MVGLPLLCVVFLVADPPWPPPLIEVVSLEDVSRLPGWDVIGRQKHLCREHIGRLEWLATVNGRHNYEASLRELERWLWWWELAEQARSDWMGEAWQLQCLMHLHAISGEIPYRQGWHPPLLPEGMRPTPPEPRDCPRG